MKEGHSTTANFNRVADVYRWAEYLALGPMLVKTRNHYIPSLSDRQCAVAYGDGDGRFLSALLQENSTVKATAIDTSARMLNLLKRRCQRYRDRVQTVQKPALCFTPGRDTDLVITHFFLDCLPQEEVDAFVGEVAASVGNGTRWLLSDFAIPRRAVLGAFASAYVRLLYLAFRLVTGLRVRSLPDHRTPLERFGFRRIGRKEFLCGLLFTELWELQTIANS